MEGNIPSGNMMQGAASYSVLDLQTSMQIPHHHHHHHHLQQSAPNPNPNFSHPGLSAAGFSHQLTQIPESSDQHSGIPFMDYGKNGPAMDHGKTLVSDEDEAVGPTDEGTGPGHSSDKGGKKGAGTPWQRMKWTDAMVKLLITAVSYTGEDTGSDCNGTRRKFTILQKKGKWKAISKVMGERGCYVSPQQCEDKFNDLNKRYKRLTDILGRGTSCKVVETPTLLEQMDLSDKVKDDVRKILSSKHLFYEEMCSYHNGNRINLPADPALQKALLLALRNREETDLTKRGFSGEGDEEEHSINSEDDEEEDMHETDLHAYSHKRMQEDNACCGNSSYGNSGGHGRRLDINQALIEGGSNCGNMSCGGSAEQALELEKNKLQLQAQSLELERQRFKWERFSKKKDRELQRMKMENERMRLENERMALELKHKELELDLEMKRGSL